MPADRPPLLPLIFLMGGLWILAAGARLDAVPMATVGSDALGQYAVALQVLEGGAWPRPPNPEGGHSLWLLVLPLVPLADSLEALFRLRFILGGLVAPLGALAAWLLASPKSRGAAAVAAGVVLAFDVGLVDTLVSSFRGYGAPELLAVATLGLALALTGRPWGLPLAGAAVVGATGQHPFAAGAAVGAVLALPGAACGVDRRWRWAAVATVALLCVPRLAHLAWLADCGDGAWACLGRVATGSAEPDTPRFEMLRRMFNDRVLVEGWWPWPLLAIGVAMLAARPVSRRRPLLGWALGTGVGVLAMGLAASSLRPYHARMAMPALAVAAAVGLSRSGRMPLALAVAALAQWAPGRTTPHADEIGPRDVDRVARQVLSVAPGPVQIEAAWWGRPVGLDPLAVSLSAWLQTERGARKARLRPGPTASVVLLTHDAPKSALDALPPDAARLDLGLAQPVGLWFPSTESAARWRSTHGSPPVTGAGEWAGVVGSSPP